jgi:hypothetical protein
MLLRNPRFAVKYLRATRGRREAPAEWQTRANDARFSEGMRAASDFPP